MSSYKANHIDVAGKSIKSLSYISCIISVAGLVWILSVNFTEIWKRLNGEYTFFSQRASLTDDEAVIYLILWNALFITLAWLSIRNLVKKKFAASIIYSIFLIILICTSDFVDKLFYHDLV